MTDVLKQGKIYSIHRGTHGRKMMQRDRGSRQPRGSQGERPGAHPSLAVFGRAPPRTRWFQTSSLQVRQCMLVVPTAQVMIHCHNNSKETNTQNLYNLLFKMKFILCLPLLKYKLHNPKAGIFFSCFILAINPRTRKCSVCSCCSINVYWVNLSEDREWTSLVSECPYEEWHVKCRSLPFCVWFSCAGVSSLRPRVLSSLQAGFGNLSHSAEDLGDGEQPSAVFRESGSRMEHLAHGLGSSYTPVHSHGH